MTDEQLMLDVRAGSRDAFEALFERHRGVVWRFFRRRVGDAGRAEELVHDVFVVVLQNAPRYEDRSAFRSYLFGIAYRLLLAYRRKHVNAPHLPEPDDLQGRSIDPDAGLWVRRALATLEPDAREVLMLREYDDLSYQEIADLLRIPLNTVRSRLFRARMDMKAALLGGAARHVKVEHGSN
jgi:RNA polymerase sigma-70 factor, ECF subfamily